MENVENIVQLDFPDMSTEEKSYEFSRAQASTAYSELSIIYRAEQSLRNIVNSKHWDSPAFQHYVAQMGIFHHLSQYRE